MVEQTSHRQDLPDTFFPIKMKIVMQKWKILTNQESYGDFCQNKSVVCPTDTPRECLHVNSNKDELIRTERSKVTVTSENTFVAVTQ